MGNFHSYFWIANILYFWEYDGKRALEVAIIHNKPSKRGYFLAQFQFIWDLVRIRIYYTIFELQLCNRYFFVFHETF